MTTSKKMMECPKCGGTGHIPHYAGIANGVCFTCAGNGKVAYRATKKKVVPMNAYFASLVETITKGDMSEMTFGQLLTLRDAAHGVPHPDCPNLLAIWRERGEQHFQAAQEERLATFRQNRLATMGY